MRLNGVVSGYPTSTNLPRVDRLSTNPQDLGRHSLVSEHRIFENLGLVGHEFRSCIHCAF